MNKEILEKEYKDLEYKLRKLNVFVGTKEYRELTTRQMLIIDEYILILIRRYKILKEVMKDKENCNNN